MIVIIDNKTDLDMYKFDNFLNKLSVENELNNNPYAIYIMYYEDEIKGYIYYSNIYDRCEINQIEVKEEYRNKKIATKLITEMLTIENKPISLEVRRDNIPAINLYKKFKFKEIAIRKNYYKGIDGILMEKK